MAFYIDTAIEQYDALVLSDYYDSPISHLATVERKLKEAGVTKGVVLFDTLLSKGNISTRFFKATLENSHFIASTFETITIDKKNPVRKHACAIISGFNLDNSLLTDLQKRLLKQGHTI